MESLWFSQTTPMDLANDPKPVKVPCPHRLLVAGENGAFVARHHRTTHHIVFGTADATPMSSSCGSERKSRLGDQSGKFFLLMRTSRA